MEPVDVPPEFENVTIEPPEVSVFPAVSFAVNVSVTFDPERTVPFEAVITEVVLLGPPGVTVTVGIAVVTLTPPTVALTVVAVPDTIPVKIAV